MIPSRYKATSKLDFSYQNKRKKLGKNQKKQKPNQTLIILTGFLCHRDLWCTSVGNTLEALPVMQHCRRRRNIQWCHQIERFGKTIWKKLLAYYGTKFKIIWKRNDHWKQYWNISEMLYSIRNGDPLSENILLHHLLGTFVNDIKGTNFWKSI